MARLHRSFLPPDRPWVDGRVTLDERESHHLAKVLRAKAGDEVETFDGGGEVRRCLMKKVSSHAVELESLEISSSAPVHPSFALGVAVPKGKKMNEIVRQAGEMGAACIVPLITARSEGSSDPGRWETKRAKWANEAIEACKQSGNPHLPEIEPFRSLGDWLTGLESETFKIVASLESDSFPLRHWLESPGSAERPQKIALLIGPEGDLTPEEYASARSAGFLPCTFGDNVLRVDTAVLCAFAVAKEEFRAYFALQPTNPRND